jgi:hypothetical protein
MVLLQYCKSGIQALKGPAGMAVERSRTEMGKRLAGEALQWSNDGAQDLSRCGGSSVNESRPQRSLALRSGNFANRNFRRGAGEVSAYQIDLALKSGGFIVLSYRSFPTVGGDQPPFLIVGQEVSAQVHALGHRIETDNLFPGLEHGTKVTLIIANLHHPVRRKLVRPEVEWSSLEVNVRTDFGATEKFDLPTSGKKTSRPPFSVKVRAGESVGQHL